MWLTLLSFNPLFLKLLLKMIIPLFLKVHYVIQTNQNFSYEVFYHILYRPTYQSKKRGVAAITPNNKICDYLLVNLLEHLLVSKPGISFRSHCKPKVEQICYFVFAGYVANILLASLPYQFKRFKYVSFMLCSEILTFIQA